MKREQVPRWVELGYEIDSITHVSDLEVTVIWRPSWEPEVEFRENPGANEAIDSMRKNMADYVRPQIEPTQVGGGSDPFRDPPVVELSVRLAPVHPEKDVIPPWYLRRRPFIQQLQEDECARGFTQGFWI